MSVYTFLKRAFLKIDSTYMCRVKCSNCTQHQDCQIPKGVSIKNYLKSTAAICRNCETASLVVISRPTNLIDKSPQIKTEIKTETKTETKVEEVKPETKSEVEPQPYIRQPKIINFWTGKEEEERQ